MKPVFKKSPFNTDEDTSINAVGKKPAVCALIASHFHCEFLYFSFFFFLFA